MALVVAGMTKRLLSKAHAGFLAATGDAKTGPCPIAASDLRGVRREFLLECLIFFDVLLQDYGKGWRYDYNAGYSSLRDEERSLFTGTSVALDGEREVVMPRFGVTPKKEEELAARMAALGIREQDLEESFVRSGGPGGQKVNRSSTCVLLRHKPSGLEVKMQKERSQALNRFFARRRLCELLEIQRLGGESPEAKKQARIRKQKDRRIRRGAEA